MKPATKDTGCFQPVSLIVYYFFPDFRVARIPEMPMIPSRIIPSHSAGAEESPVTGTGFDDGVGCTDGLGAG